MINSELTNTWNKKKNVADKVPATHPQRHLQQQLRSTYQTEKGVLLQKTEK